MLSNWQLYDLSKRHNTPLELATFKDEIPKQIKYNRGYIVNLEDSINDDGKNNVGSHWTAFQINKTIKNGKIILEPYYFDSYGVVPPTIIEKILKRNSHLNKIPYNKKDIQGLKSESCGWYCLAWLYFINNDKLKGPNIYESSSTFMDLFKDCSKDDMACFYNEFILKHFFRSADPSKRKPIDIERTNNEDLENPDTEFIPVEVK